MLIINYHPQVVSMASIHALPAPETPLTTSLVEALHFRRGFHYIAVQTMEMEIPIPSTESKKKNINIQHCNHNNCRW